MTISRARTRAAVAGSNVWVQVTLGGMQARGCSLAGMAAGAGMGMVVAGSKP